MKDTGISLSIYMSVCLSVCGHAFSRVYHFMLNLSGCKKVKNLCGVDDYRNQ
jgi:hypothetical protein